MGWRILLRHFIGTALCAACAHRRLPDGFRHRGLPGLLALARDRLPHRLSQRAAVARARPGGSQGIHLAARALGAGLHADLSRIERAFVGQGRYPAHRARYAVRDFPALVGDAFAPPAGACRAVAVPAVRHPGRLRLGARRHFASPAVLRRPVGDDRLVDQWPGAAADERLEPTSRCYGYHQVRVHRPVQAAGAEVPGNGQRRRPHEGFRAVAHAAHLRALPRLQRGRHPVGVPARRLAVVGRCERHRLHLELV